MNDSKITPKVNEIGQIQFDSMQALKAAITESGMRLRPYSSWVGETEETLHHKLENGDVSQVENARRMLEDFNFNINLTGETTFQRGWADAPMGAFPNVPAFLSGAPECMRQRLPEMAERKKVCVWMDVTSSGGVNHELLAKRGMSALALIMKLQAENIQVEFKTFTSLGGCGKHGQSVVIVNHDLETTDLATIAFATTSQGFSRTVCYETAYKLAKGNGSWANNASPHRGIPERIEAARKFQLDGLTKPTDVILPLVFAHDNKTRTMESLVFTDAPRWVEHCLSKINAEG